MLGDLTHQTARELDRITGSILKRGERTAFDETELDQVAAELERRGWESAMERDLR